MTDSPELAAIRARADDPYDVRITPAKTDRRALLRMLDEARAAYESLNLLTHETAEQLRKELDEARKETENWRKDRNEYVELSLMYSRRIDELTGVETMTTIEIEGKEYTWDQLKELKRDAERYRWLRERMSYYKISNCEYTVWHHDTESTAPTVDRMIDESMQKS